MVVPTTGVLKNTTHLLLGSDWIGTFGFVKQSHFRLQSGYFIGLHNLTYLNLDLNKMCMDYAAYPSGLFRDTVKLKVLKLYGRSDCRHKYLEETIESLKYLEDITLPFAKIPVFGEGFGLLKSLKKINKIKETCAIKC